MKPTWCIPTQGGLFNIAKSIEGGDMVWEVLMLQQQKNPKIQTTFMHR